MRHLTRTLALAAIAALLAACSTLDSELERSALLPADANPERFIVITIQNEHATLMPRAGSTARSYAAPARYAVSPAAQARTLAIATSYNLREVAAWPIGVLGVHCLVYELPTDTDRAELLERLRRDPRVESAQPLQSFNTLSSGQADPYRSLQRNLDVMNVTRAHRLSRGEGVRIGVVDTGVDLAHPDLVGRIVEYRDFVNRFSRTALPERHGTAVAGIIGALADNELGIVGIAPAAKIYALRACWTDGSASGATCNTLTLAKALVRAIDARLNVVNLSLAGPADPLLARLVRAGMQRGIVFVGAAPPGRPVQTFPTAVAGVIGVDLAGKGSVDATLLAPGEDVLTLAPNGSYDFLSGSSLAAASITGGIALLLAKEKNLSATDVRTLLADSHPGVSASADSTRGVDLCVALTRLLRKGSCD
jgi:subtilisin family serine protease